MHGCAGKGHKLQPAIPELVQALVYAQKCESVSNAGKSAGLLVCIVLVNQRSFSQCLNSFDSTSATWHIDNFNKSLVATWHGSQVMRRKGDLTTEQITFWPTCMVSEKSSQSSWQISWLISMLWKYSLWITVLNHCCYHGASQENTRTLATKM